jgi:hypothetical protein
MIKATGGTTDGTPMIWLGLSRENTRRLHADEPIRIRTDHVDPRLPPLEIVLFAGETEEEMAATLKAFER